MTVEKRYDDVNYPESFLSHSYSEFGDGWLMACSYSSYNEDHQIISSYTYNAPGWVITANYYDRSKENILKKTVMVMAITVADIDIACSLAQAKPPEITLENCAIASVEYRDNSTDPVRTSYYDLSKDGTETLTKVNEKYESGTRFITYYKPDGRIYMTEEYMLDNTKLTTYYYEDGTSSTSAGTYTITTFSPDDKPTRKDTVLGYYEYAYSPSGYLIYMDEYRGTNDPVLNYHYVYQYDTQGRQILESIYSIFDIILS